MFYVYLYLRDDGTPYYVGKGKGRRAYNHGGRPCKKPSDISRIIIHTENLTEDRAFSLEKELILKYGENAMADYYITNRWEARARPDAGHQRKLVIKCPLHIWV